MVTVPPVGSRVSIRYRLPAGEFTDVIGHVLAMDPVVLRTKSGELVEIAPADVVAVRELSHAPVRASPERVRAKRPSEANSSVSDEPASLERHTPMRSRTGATRGL